MGMLNKCLYIILIWMGKKGQLSWVMGMNDRWVDGMEWMIGGWWMWKWTIMWDNKWHRISNTFQILWITCKGCLNIKIQQLFG